MIITITLAEDDVLLANMDNVAIIRVIAMEIGEYDSPDNYLRRAFGKYIPYDRIDKHTDIIIGKKKYHSTRTVKDILEEIQSQIQTQIQKEKDIHEPI